MLFLSIICASGLTMVSVCNTMIDTQSWAPIFQLQSKLRETIFIMLTQDVFSPSPGP
jgi:hypothetical protein